MYRQWHLKNNIFINNKTNSSGTGTHLAIAVHDPYFVGNSDFNNFYVDSSNSYLALWLNSYVNDIEEWRSLSNRDFNSVSTSISFVSDIDLHLSGNSLGDTLLIATPLPLINKDIDDEIRNLQFPYKGADENLEYPLPVELLTFSASLLNGNVNLTWISTSETNNQGFEILRFAQDDIDWSKIGFVEGRGTTTEPQFYSFTDESLQPGKYQYRLKQIDFDGSFEYSKVVEVTVQESTKFSLFQNYPNPFNPTTKIKYEIPNVETRHASSLQFIALKVYDILGNEVASLVNEEKQPGFYEVEFNAKELSSGIYYYQLNTGTFIQTKKMILLK